MVDGEGVVHLRGVAQLIAVLTSNAEDAPRTATPSAYFIAMLSVLELVAHGAEPIALSLVDFPREIGRASIGSIGSSASNFVRLDQCCVTAALILGGPRQSDQQAAVTEDFDGVSAVSAGIEGCAGLDVDDRCGGRQRTDVNLDLRRV